MFVKVAVCVLLAACTVQAVLRARPQLVVSTADGKNVMELDGSNSRGEIESYKWTLLNTQYAGQEIDAARATFSSSLGGRYKWQLEVCDVAGTCHASNVRSPLFEDQEAPGSQLQGPTVRGSMSIRGSGGTYTITLDASGSTDDNGIASFVWEMVDGDDVGKTFDTAVATYVTQNPGHYKWTVTACDTDALCASATLEVDI